MTPSASLKASNIDVMPPKVLGMPISASLDLNRYVDYINLIIVFFESPKLKPSTYLHLLGAGVSNMLIGLKSGVL